MQQNKLIDRITEVTGGKGGSVFLILGSEKTALYDCGMAYCVREMLARLQGALDGRPLDYILISHSHYDHIMAMPYLRECWPDVVAFGSSHAYDVLGRPGARQTMRMLSREAAEYYGAEDEEDYGDALLRVDCVVGEGDCIDLGDLSVRVLETPGHTKCCLTYLLDDQMIFPSETTCYKSRSGKVYPAFLSGCTAALDSLYHCAEQRATLVMAPHYGLVCDWDAPTYWRECLASILENRDFIVDCDRRGLGEEQILLAYEKRFRDEEIRSEQPDAAFVINTRAMIRTVLRERAMCLRSPREGEPLPR